MGDEKRSQSIYTSFSYPTKSESANLTARYYNNDSGDKGDRERYMKDVQKAGETEVVDMGEPLTSHPEDSTLSVKVKMRVEGDRLADILAALAESSGHAIVSDCLDAKLRNINFPASEIEVRAVLDKLEHDYRYNWEKHNNTLEFHSRDWFRKCSALIPEAMLEPWREALKISSTLDLDALSQIAALTPQQFSVNVSTDDVLGNAGLDGAISGNRDLLRLYAGLDKRQKPLVFTKQGLSTDQGLSLDFSADTSRIDPMVDMRRSALQRSFQDGLRLVGTREKHGKQTQYIFHVVKPSGEDACAVWKFDTPVYSTPPPSIR